MDKDQIMAKLIALSAIYEKEEHLRQPFLERLTFHPDELHAVLEEVSNPELKEWIQSVASITKHS